MQLSDRLFKAYRYEAADIERKKLPYDYALLFCRKDLGPDCVRTINKLTQTIANLLYNNITPMQAPRFDS